LSENFGFDGVIKLTVNFLVLKTEISSIAMIA